MWGSPAAAGLVCAAVALAGCGDPDDSSSTATTGAPSDACGAGSIALSDGRCQPAGLPIDMPCPPGETPNEGACCPAGTLALPGGECRPAGVPPERCGEGFVADETGGCVAVLPEVACARGWLAVPGEGTCHQVAPCGSGAWGDIPVEASTQYADGAYAGGDGIGTAAKPWTSVQDAIDAAAPGAIVAIAEGTYAEQLLVDRPVRIWGRCPSMVTLEGTDPMVATVRVLPGADASELRDLGVTGPGVGVVVSGARGVMLDRVWLHDLGDSGFTVWDLVGPASATLSRSLVERTREAGVLAFGGAVTVESSVIREILADLAGNFGRGVAAQINPTTGVRADATVRGSFVDRVRSVGIFVAGSDAVIESTLVRGPPAAQTEGGRGISLQAEPKTRARSLAIVLASVVERARGIGVHVSGSDGTIEDSVVRDTVGLDEAGGRGVNVQRDDDPPSPATIDVRASVVERNRDIGIFAAGAAAHVEATIVRQTEPVAGLGGRGIALQLDPVSGEGSSSTVRACVVEENHDVGIFVGAAQASVESTLVRDTLPDSEAAGRGLVFEESPDDSLVRWCVVERSVECGILVAAARVTLDSSVVRATASNDAGLFGRGVSLADGSAATLRSSIIEDSVEDGVAILDSTATFETSVIRGTKARLDGLFGDGVAAATSVASTTPASASLTSTLVEASARAGVSSFGASVSLRGDSLLCGALDLVGQDYEGVPHAFDDLGANACGCAGTVGPCVLVDADLAPPEPIDP